MTLKGYTNFVVKFARVAYDNIPNLVTEQEKERLRVLIKEGLVPLIGLENWWKLVNVFTKNLGFPEGSFRYTSVVLEQIVWNREKFKETLAEFCEPLIERTAEKPEGGQDAAKV